MKKGLSIEIVLTSCYERLIRARVVPACLEIGILGCEGQGIVEEAMLR